MITPNDLILSSSPPETYMFSTHIQNLKINTENLKKDKKKSTVTMSYKDYMENPNSLKKYKIPELKSIAKNLRIHITCTKPILIERIENHFRSIKHIIFIQSIYRGHIVRQSFKLRGDTTSRCTNDSDPCTLEPINEIPFEFFFSYKDTKGHIYGFNIISLITLLKSAKKIENPYTREVLDKDTVNRVIHLYKLICIIFREIARENDAPIITNQHINTINITQRYNEVASQNRNTRTEFIMNQVNTPAYQEIVAKLEEIRRRPIQTRITELFMEIDQLGNYTQSAWFSNLERREYLKLYRCLYDIWNYRSQLSYQMKRNICVTGDPFHNIINTAGYFNEFSLERIQQACLTVFENMVFAGIDIEYRKIGAFHALSALTLVSMHARLSMPWLYESVAII